MKFLEKLLRYLPYYNYNYYTIFLLLLDVKQHKLRSVSDRTLSKQIPYSFTDTNSGNRCMNGMNITIILKMKMQ